MRTMRGLVMVLLSAFGLVALGSATAYACSCVEQTPRSAYDGAVVVVDATVVQHDTPLRMTSSADTARYLLEVHTVYKGVATERLEIGSLVSGASCGLEDVHVDDRKVFFLYETTGEEWDPDTALAANLCGGTGQFTPDQVERVADGRTPPSSDASPVAGPEAGGPVARDPEPGGPSRLWPTSAELTAYAVGGTLLALLAAGAWVLVRRRRLARG